MELFEHTPLSNPEREIRLLGIQEPDQFTLTTWPVDNAPAYAAVSYVWGAPIFSKTIVVNEKRFDVTENAHQALQQVRNATVRRNLEYVWIDTVCINQRSNHEKSRQVGIMGNIYEGAHTVFACIGEHDMSSRTIFSRALAVAGSEADSPLPPLPCPLMDWQRRVRDFLSRPYWSRLWIVQELIRAKATPYLLCGDDEMRCDMRAMPSWSTLPLIRGHTARDIISSAEKKVQKQSFDILLQRFWTMECAEPKDRIYGLLGMTSNPTGRIQNDYGKSRIELLCEAASELCASSYSDESTVDILCSIRRIILALHHRVLVMRKRYVYLYWDYDRTGKTANLLDDLVKTKPCTFEGRPSGLPVCRLRVPVFVIVGPHTTSNQYFPERGLLASHTKVEPGNRKPTILRYGHFCDIELPDGVKAGDVIIDRWEKSSDSVTTRLLILRWRESTGSWAYHDAAWSIDRADYLQDPVPSSHEGFANLPISAPDLLELGARQVYGQYGKRWQPLERPDIETGGSSRDPTGTILRLPWLLRCDLDKDSDGATWPELLTFFLELTKQDEHAFEELRKLADAPRK